MLTQKQMPACLLMVLGGDSFTKTTASEIKSGCAQMVDPELLAEVVRFVDAGALTQNQGRKILGLPPLRHGNARPPRGPKEIDRFISSLVIAKDESP